ncbi:MAG: DUF1566 domain-containing protein [Bacteroidales bacterium]|nr:DUF1566 domain-containing protein [Bacteroidales bacterium]
MKKTFAYIRTLAAVLMTSAAFVACNKEDIATAEQAPQVYTLTIQAGMNDGTQTKALELEGTKLVAKWEAGDELTVINVTSGTPLGGTLTASNVSANGQTCTFSGTLTGTIEVNNQLALHYHATSGTQDGTLESAAANDQAFANVTVASVEAGNITISGGTATFNTTTAVLKLTLKDGSANALNATSLKMTVDGVDIFTASPTAATYTANGNGVLYFAVPRQIEAAEKIVVVKTDGHPTEPLLNTWMTNLNTYDVTFTATVGSDTYTATKTGYKLAAGKYYATELTMAKPAPTLSLTSPAAGQVIGSDGKNYAAGASLPTGVTKVAMIAYVDGENHGLAIALADESGSMNWSTAKTTCEAKTPAFTGGTWKLPSLDEWKNMLTYDGDSYWNNNLQTALSTAGGNSLQEWMYYWSSTDYVSDNTQAYDVEFMSGYANFSNESKTYTSGMLVRAVLAF